MERKYEVLLVWALTLGMLVSGAWYFYAAWKKEKALEAMIATMRESGGDKIELSDDVLKAMNERAGPPVQLEAAIIDSMRE